MIKILNTQFYPNRTWGTPLNWTHLPQNSSELLEIFDQNGYRLTKLEQAYSHVNEQPYAFHGDEKSIRKHWMAYTDVTTGAHLNHAFLFERKGYDREAYNQLVIFAKQNNLVNKLVNYVGKWGVDFSMDYVDANGNSMEILHFEYDSYSLDEIQEVKDAVEKAVTSVDWDDAAKAVLKRKGEWINLEFFEQSKWKTDFFGLPAERFKMNAWE